jgi:hypothetical protein
MVIKRVSFVVFTAMIVKRERERERERKNLSSVLKIPRQCPLILMVGVKHIHTYTYKPSSYLTAGTLHLRYRAQPVNAM